MKTTQTEADLIKSIVLLCKQHGADICVRGTGRINEFKILCDFEGGGQMSYWTQDKKLIGDLINKNIPLSSTKGQRFQDRIPYITRNQSLVNIAQNYNFIQTLKTILTFAENSYSDGLNELGKLQGYIIAKIEDLEANYSEKD